MRVIGRQRFDSTLPLLGLVYAGGGRAGLPTGVVMAVGGVVIQQGLIEARELRLRQVAAHLSHGSTTGNAEEERRKEGRKWWWAAQGAREEEEEEWEWPEWWPLKKLNKAERAKREEEDLRRRLARLQEE